VPRLLTLADQLRVGRFTIYRDVVRDRGRRSYSSTFYALADSPRLARDIDGRPAFDFVWYRGQPSSGLAVDAGGLVTITTEFGPSDDERGELIEGIRSAVEPSPADPIVAPVPFRAGDVQLTFADDQSGELATVAPRFPASLQGTQRATFVIPLTAVGAGLLWHALESGTDLFHARYELVFVQRLDEVSLRVWCDGRRAHDAASARAAAGSLDVPALTSSLVDAHIAGVELVSTRAIGDEQRSALEDIGLRLLTAAISAAIVDDAPANGSPTLRPYSPAIDSALNVMFEESYPLEAHAVAQGVVRLGSTIVELGDRIRLVEPDRGFFRILEVKIICTVDFEESIIESVRVTVTYDATGTTRVFRSAEFVFRAGVGPQTFRTDLATPDERAVSYDVEVFYRDGGPPLRISTPRREVQLIVLDLERAGVLDVELTLRDVPPDAGLVATIELRHEPSGAEATFILDREHPEALWSAVVRERAGPYEYRVTWTDPNGARTITEWVESSQPELAFDAPASLRPASEVHVIAAGHFENVVELVVELRTAESGSATFTFKSSGQTEIWKLPGGTEPPSYEVRQWIVYSDGARTEFPWERRDGSVLVVGDLLRFEVVVTPRLLDIGGSVRLAMVELVDDADGGSGARATLVFRDPESQTWSFRMRDPAVHAYTYQLTLVHADGRRDVGPRQTSDAGVLVLRPIISSPEN
jgi:hypothetical protein